MREEPGTHLDVPMEFFFSGFGCPSGDVETGGGVAGAGWTSGDGARMREVE
jgi:hypothetical protein